LKDLLMRNESRHDHVIAFFNLISILKYQGKKFKIRQKTKFFVGRKTAKSTLIFAHVNLELIVYNCDSNYIREALHSAYCGCDGCRTSITGVYDW
jgi:hypothetical protein